jgi:hypothetical protein
MESFSTWAFDMTQRYEVCATRHNDCAERIINTQKEGDHE